MRQSVSVSGDKKLTNFTWYDNNDKAVKSENVSGNKNTYTSTLNLADFIQSAGSHGFYCIVKDSTNTTVKSRTALVTIGGDYNVKITPSASSVKPGGNGRQRRGHAEQPHRLVRDADRQVRRHRDDHGRDHH